MAVTAAMDIAQRFPLVARPRPACGSLTVRVQEIRELAHRAEHDCEPAAAAAALNKAALIASDCGLPVLARRLCHLHAAACLDAPVPLDAQGARRALEPLVNLARLQTREGDGEGAYRLLDTLFTAATTRTDTKIDHQPVPFSRLIAQGEDHRTLCTWLWTILLADGTRALTRAGQWDKAFAHLQQHKGIGQRMMDGRQVAILAHLFAEEPTAALDLLHDSALDQRWEHAVAACLKVLCRSASNQPTGTAVADMTDYYLNLPPDPKLVVFHTRVGMATADLAGRTAQATAAACAATQVIRQAVAAKDGYAAREVLAHDICRTHLRTTDQRILTDVTNMSGLDRGGIPDDLMSDVISTVQNLLTPVQAP
jgi:hypothetical protein